MKTKISVTIDPNLLEWIQDKVKQKVFSHVSHGVEYSLHQTMQNDSV